MTNEPRAMREIHEIREQISEELKNMTPKEQTAYFRKAAQDMIEKHGLNVNRPEAVVERKIV